MLAAAAFCFHTLYTFRKDLLKVQQEHQLSILQLLEKSSMFMKQGTAFCMFCLHTLGGLSEICYSYNI